MASVVMLIVSNLETVLAVILAAKVAAEAIVNLTPTPKDDKVVGKFYKVIEAIAGIFSVKAKEFPGSKEMKQRVHDTAKMSSVSANRVDMSEVDAWLNRK